MKLHSVIPKHIRKLKPYIAGKTIAEVAREHKPDRIAKLASNENRLGCSPAVPDAVLKACSTIHDYPDPIARQLRQAIAERCGVPQNQLIIAAGSESIISILCRTLFNPGENAVTADATFVGFYVQTGVQHIHLKRVPLSSAFGFDVEEILKSVDENTKLVYIANPNNPTGTYITKREYEKLITGLPENVILVMDEAYFEFSEKIPDYPNAIENRPENVIVLRTFSKAYGLAGFRIGYGIADPRLIEQMMKTKLTFEPTATAQAAALAALDDDDFLNKSVQNVQTGRKRLNSFFDERGVEYVPSVSNSVMMICNHEHEAHSITHEMLKKGVILRQLQAFGLPNCIRITVGSESDMDQFEECFDSVLANIS